MSGAVNPVVLYPPLKTPTSIVNAFAANGYMPTGFTAQYGMKQIPSGALVANTLKAVLTLAGSGVLNFLGVQIQDGTARTMRMQLVLDGVTVFDSTSVANAALGNGAWIIGTYFSASTYALDQIPFKSSCVLSVASSLTENNTLLASAIYRMT